MKILGEDKIHQNFANQSSFSGETGNKPRASQPTGDQYKYKYTNTILHKIQIEKTL